MLPNLLIDAVKKKLKWLINSVCYKSFISKCGVCTYSNLLSFCLVFFIFYFTKSSVSFTFCTSKSLVCNSNSYLCESCLFALKKFLLYLEAVLPHLNQFFFSLCLQNLKTVSSVCCKPAIGILLSCLLYICCCLEVSYYLKVLVNL